MPHARIIIETKQGVFDPQARVILDGLARLGHDRLDRVGVGKVIDLHFDRGSRGEVSAEIETMCDQLLVNPVIEDYWVEFLDD